MSEIVLEYRHEFEILNTVLLQTRFAISFNLQPSFRKASGLSIQKAHIPTTWLSSSSTTIIITATTITTTNYSPHPPTSAPLLPQLPNKHKIHKFGLPPYFIVLEGALQQLQTPSSIDIGPFPITLRFLVDQHISLPSFSPELLYQALSQSKLRIGLRHNLFQISGVYIQIDSPFFSSLSSHRLISPRSSPHTSRYTNLHYHVRRSDLPSHVSSATTFSSQFLLQTRTALVLLFPKSPFKQTAYTTSPDKVHLKAPTYLRSLKPTATRSSNSTSPRRHLRRFDSHTYKQEGSRSSPSR